ncbi:OmpA family protein [Pseudomonas alkylphenolica]|jgi:outer membrane protein OmpA-like peptidoglycan-associated protein|uniref:OmpA family protein n=1 Tax=Pseudomonas alkylphenolica TaxID=237609 RepID=A0A6I6HD66_9PSED|nr:OmpA family protein [Pseudomonas alkylphenolica]QGW78115.1 OmpA family protein [Pseudomonas alkylphenolica]
MQLKYLFIAVSAAGLILSGCGTTPENAGLLEAREQFSALQSKPESTRLAGLETKAAFAALGQADLASLKDRKAPQVEQLAYLAKQKIAIAEQTIDLRKAEAGLLGIEAQRTQARLDVRTAQLKALQQLNAKQTDRGAVVTFGDVLFDTGRAELKASSLRNLDQLTEYLRANPERKVRVEGFTDSTGGDAFNQQLSERRAAAVANALRRAGVAPERVKVAGYGKEFPVASNADAQSRQLNRRVEVIISHGSNAVSDRS